MTLLCILPCSILTVWNFLVVVSPCVISSFEHLPNPKHVQAYEQTRNSLIKKGITFKENIYTAWDKVTDTDTDTDTKAEKRQCFSYLCLDIHVSTTAMALILQNHFYTSE